MDTDWAAGDRVFSSLRAAGVAVWEGRVGAPVIAEVARPEGTHVLALTVADAPAQEARPQQTAVWTAPRLREVLLDALAPNSQVRLLAELERRSIPLVFMLDVAGSPTMWSWPHVAGPVLPVFADLASLYRAAREIKPAEQKFGFAAMKFGELQEWAGTDFAVAIGVLPAARLRPDVGSLAADARLRRDMWPAGAYPPTIHACPSDQIDLSTLRSVGAHFPTPARRGSADGAEAELLGLDCHQRLLTRCRGRP